VRGNRTCPLAAQAATNPAAAGDLISFLQALPDAGVPSSGEILWARFPGSSPTSTRRTMPTRQSAAAELASLLDGSSAGKLIPELTRHGLQQLIELEVAAFLSADRHEGTDERLGYHNGYRSRTLTTQVGDLALQIPKLRAGSFIPSILEPRRRIDQALYAVIMESSIGGATSHQCWHLHGFMLGLT